MLQQFDAIAIDYNGTAATNSDFGKIVLAGISLDNSSSKERMVVARLNSNGKPDNSFAGDGRFAALRSPATMHRKLTE